MKKILLLLILLPIVLAISVAPPKERELIYEGGETTFEYSIPNGEPITLHAEAKVTADKLLNAQLSENKFTIPPYTTKSFTVKINAENLPPGLYPVSTDVMENNPAGGMSGLTGVTDIVNIISPYEEGHAYGTFHAGNTQQPNTQIKTLLQVQNIGKTNLENIQAEIELYLNDTVVTKTTTNNKAALKPYAKTSFDAYINATNLTPGYYTIKVTFSEQTTSRTIILAKPTVSIYGVPELKANQNNTFNATIKLDNWATTIPNATIELRVPNLLKTQKTITLHPGENTIEFEAQAKPAKGGLYNVKITIFGQFLRAESSTQTQVEGGGITGGIGFAKTPEQIEAEEQMAAQTKTTASKPRNEIFLMILLVASFIIFAFALGNYFAKRKNETQTQ